MDPRVALCQVFEVIEGYSKDTVDDLEAVKVGGLISSVKVSYVGGHGDREFVHEIYRLISAGLE